MELFKRDSATLKLRDLQQYHLDMSKHSSFVLEGKEENKLHHQEEVKNLVDFTLQEEKVGGSFIAEWKANFRESVKLTSERNDGRLFSMYFELADGFYLKSKSAKRMVDGRAAYMFANSQGTESSVSFYKKGSCQHTFIVSFTPDKFKRIAESTPALLEDIYKRFENNEPLFLYNPKKIVTAEMHFIMSQIKHNNLPQDIREMYVESKTLELLSLQLSNFSSPQKSETFISNLDKKKLEFARDIIKDTVSSPMTIKELSKEAGINEMKLKSGFKNLFGCTVHNYMVDERLYLSKSLLLADDKGVAEVAQLCGYEYASHFSTAFRKRFGLSPREFMKNNR